MTTPLHALIIEDSPDDAELLLRELKRGGFDVSYHRVETAEALQQALTRGGWQIVLCDFSLPHFDGKTALHQVKASGVDLPFIFVSGTMGEDVAVAAMKMGADDYVMKDRLARLVPAVTRELRDADERREAQKALRLSQQAYASLVNSIEGIVWECDAENLRFQFVSQRAERLLGYPIEHWITEPNFWRDHIHPQDRQWAMDYCLQAVRKLQDHSFTYRMIAADGRVVWLNDLVTVVHEPGRPVLLRGVMVDITESKRAEEALRASEQRFRQVTENIDEVFWLTDVSKNEMIYVSPAYARVWGRTCESLIADPQSWVEAVQAEDRERVRAAAMTLQREGAYDLEYRIVRPDGSERWVHDRAFPIRDANNRVYRIAGVAEDVTGRRQLEDQLRQAQKMEAVGRLAGGVAHDFNNLLAVIQMASSSLLTRSASAEEIRDGLEQILTSSERGANLTRQLLTFSRRSKREARDIDLAEVTDGMAKLLRRVLGEDLTLETRMAHALPMVNADPGMMEQVLMNLAVNARDAMPNGGRLVVALDAVQISVADAARNPRAVPGRFVRLLVQDTGCGIPSADLPRIFEPFFTTKAPGKGTGLGLATVFGIVEQHHGWIDVASRVGQGTTFEIFLPALPGARVTARKEISALKLAAGTESILLVEDDPAVRKLTKASLEYCGYRVLEADSAASALDLWESLAEPIHLLFTDLIMPGGLTGCDLADRLLERKPGLKIIYSSGYSHDVVRPDLHLTPGYNFLQKPYRLTEMAATVRRRLDER
jgi:two-component system, cell cycle sensor histidine kinase and response regulator CckA